MVEEKEQDLTLEQKQKIEKEVRNIIENNAFENISEQEILSWRGDNEGFWAFWKKYLKLIEYIDILIKKDNTRTFENLKPIGFPFPENFNYEKLNETELLEYDNLYKWFYESVRNGNGRKDIEEFNKTDKGKRFGELREKAIIKNEEIAKKTLEELEKDMKLIDILTHKGFTHKEAVYGATKTWETEYWKKETEESHPINEYKKRIKELDAEIKRLKEEKALKPTKGPHEFFLTWPELTDPKRKITKKDKAGQIKILDKLPPESFNIVLAYLYFLDPEKPFDWVYADTVEWLDVLNNSRYLTTQNKKIFGGQQRKQLDTLFHLMNDIHHPPIWRQDWVTQFDRRGKKLKEKEAWKFEGTALQGLITVYHLKPHQNINLMSQEEKENLLIKGYKIKLAEPFLFGLTSKGIGYSLYYHKKIMELLRKLGKNLIAKSIVNYALAQSKMDFEISKGLLSRWCFCSKPEYWERNKNRCIERTKKAIKLLKKEKIFSQIEENVPYANNRRNELGETYFDRYYKSPEYFFDNAAEILGLKVPEK